MFGFRRKPAPEKKARAIELTREMIAEARANSLSGEQLVAQGVIQAYNLLPDTEVNIGVGDKVTATFTRPGRSNSEMRYLHTDALELIERFDAGERVGPTVIPFVQ